MIIEYCRRNQFTKERDQDDGNITQTMNISLKYDKKTKTWFGKRNALLIKAPDKLVPHIMLYRVMKPEEQTKYNILWEQSDYEE